MISKAKITSLLAACALFGAADQASAVGLTLNFHDGSTQSSNATHTGASGRVSFSFADVSSGVEVKLAIKNTTTGAFGAGATEAILSGFGFDLFDGLSYVAGSFMPGSQLAFISFNQATGPFGKLDLAVSDDGRFNGGNANKHTGLAAGDATQLSFVLASTTSLLNAAALSDMFASAFAAADPLDAVLRFQKVNAGAGNDRLLYTGEKVTPTPLPATLPLLLAALGGLAFATRRSRDAARNRHT